MQSHSQEADIKRLAKPQQTMKLRRVAEEQHSIRLCVIPRLLVVMSFLSETLQGFVSLRRQDHLRQLLVP